MLQRSNALAKPLSALAKGIAFLRIGNVPTWCLIVIPSSIVCIAVIAVVPPLLIGKLIDAIEHRDIGQTVHVLVWYVAITIGASIINFANGYSSSVFRETLARHVQLDLVRKLFRARFEHLFTLTLGQLANRVTTDVRTLCSQLEYSLFPTLATACSLLATIVMLLKQNALLGFIALLSSLGALIPARLIRPRIAAIQAELASAGDELYGVVAASTSPLSTAVFRNTTASMRWAKSFDSLTRRIFAMRVAQHVVSGYAALIYALISTIGPAIVLLLGVDMALHGRLTAGAIVSIMIYQSRLSGPMNNLAQLAFTFAGLDIVISRLTQIIELPEESSGAEAFQPGDVRFEDVRLSRGSHDILRGITITLRRGKLIAVVGSSGAGKSTLASMIVRLYDPDRGTVSLGPTDLRNLRLESLRSAVSIVASDSMILDCSLLDNLTLASDDDNNARIQRAIEIVRLDELLSRLPEGLNARLGSTGVRLSTGERQRICLARAILQDAQIVILDEALTGVDLETERDIMRDVRDAFPDRTILVITHRLEFLSSFDEVIVMHEGGIALRGAPYELERSKHWRSMAGDLKAQSPTTSISSVA